MRTHDLDDINTDKDEGNEDVDYEKMRMRAMVRVTARATARAIGPSSWEYEHPL